VVYLSRDAGADLSGSRVARLPAHLDRELGEDADELRLLLDVARTPAGATL
jgi:hypothetical protein